MFLIKYFSELYKFNIQHLAVYDVIKKRIQIAKPNVFKSTSKASRVVILQKTLHLSDTFPKRKPIGIEEQIATDAQGRRRFHGAFTGGFSAGFFNTVGTPEGWAPTEFKSSRADKAQSKAQKPQDYMDDEDMGEFGFAPETIKAADEFSTKRKRKKQPFSTGPIPGVPVLHSLLQVHTEAIGLTLMKNMGWKMIGDNEEPEDEEPQNEAGAKVYGCVIPKAFRMISSDKFTVGAQSLKCTQPYSEIMRNPKCNTSGMGYFGLDKSIFGHVNLLEPSKLVVRDKNNKRSTIRGQAFGVGAFEREDEDIYRTEDMGKYDFSLEDAAEPSKKPLAIAFRQEASVLQDFVRAKVSFTFPCSFPVPAIPHSFSGKHKVKRSRFEPIPPEFDAEVLRKKAQHTAETRAELLKDYRERKDEEAKKNAVRNAEAHKKNLEMLLTGNRFVSADDGAEKAASKQETGDSGEKESAEPEKTSAFFADRFISSSNSEDSGVRRVETLHGTKDMRKAVEMKMFGALTRTAASWNPSAMLCKKFNVPPPLFDGSASKSEKKRTKLLIFEYQKAKDVEGDLKPGLTEPKIVPEPVEEAIAEETLEKVDDPVSEEAEIDAEVQEVQQLDPQRDLDLFKAVFLSSSDEEDSEKEEAKEVEEEENRFNVFAKEVTEAVLPKIVPKKIGILSNLTFTKPGSRKIDVEETEVEVSKDRISFRAPVVDLYGPQLPSKCDNSRVAVSSNPVKMKTFQDEEWIEKNDAERLTKGKKKKHKKEHEKKKHRSKHKKKHKKDKK